jgi:hypothetical protein
MQIRKLLAISFAVAIIGGSFGDDGDARRLDIQNAETLRTTAHPIHEELDPNGVIVNANWAGYEVANWQTGQLYTQAEASWVVPTVKFGQSTDPTIPQEVVIWVGIGGFYEEDPNACGFNQPCPVDSSLIQIGTVQTVMPNGQITLQAFYETVDLDPITLTPTGSFVAIPTKEISIAPGDTVFASITCSGANGTACPSPLNVRAAQYWTLYLQVSNKKGKLQVWPAASSHGKASGGSNPNPIIHQSNQLSAEWILESPNIVWNGSVIQAPLPQFTITPISATRGANFTTQPLSESNKLFILDRWGQKAYPSDPPSAFDDFDVCYFASGQSGPCS